MEDIDYEELLGYIARLNININFRENANGGFVTVQIDSYDPHTESLEGTYEVTAMITAVRSAITEYKNYNV